MSIKVIVAGFKGRMGSAAVNMVKGDDELTLAALLDPFATEKEVDGVPVFTDKSQLVGFDADVWVDFTMPAVAYENTRFALENGFAPVVGTTGFSEDEIAELIALSEDKKIGGLIAPNFAIGAILLMEFAAKAAKYFPDLEIIELHHDKKKDAPSGTAVKTAELIREVRQAKKQGAPDEVETLKGARGADFDGMRIHSVRLPGLVAHQEVIFGAQGEGSVSLDGTLLNGKKPYKIASLGLSRTFQNIRLFKDMTVLENVLVGMANQNNPHLLASFLRLPKFYHSEAKLRQKAMELLAIFDLDGDAETLAKNLPYGQQRRLEIVRALATEPKILFLDEPAAGMNPQETAELTQLIRRIKEEFDITIMLIEHDMSLVMEVTERIYVLEYGRLIAHGTPDEIKTNQRVIEAYLGGEG
jgi:4-hydroxy-tetrahydrodipicolinate reductase